MPTSPQMVAAISSLRAPMPSAMACTYLARSLGLVADQAGKAATAAATARSTSAAVPSGMRAHDLLGGGVDHVDRAGAVGRHPGAVDVELVVVSWSRRPCGSPGASLVVSVGRYRQGSPHGHGSDRLRPDRHRCTGRRGLRAGRRHHQHGPLVTRVLPRPRGWAAPPRRCPAPSSRAGTGARSLGLPAKWSTTSTIRQADPGRAFSFDTGLSGARWTYRFEPTADGTGCTVTETREEIASPSMVCIKVLSMPARGHPPQAAARRHGGHPQRLKAAAEAELSSAGRQLLDHRPSDPGRGRIARRRQALRRLAHRRRHPPGASCRWPASP